MTKTAEELRVKLEGKTDRTEIEAILNGTIVTALKAYMKEEGFDCTGYHTWKKADFVETIAVALMADIASEQPTDVATVQSETTAKIDVEEWVKRNEEAKIIRLQNAHKNADREPDEGLSYEECVKLVNDLLYGDAPRYKDECATNAVRRILLDCKPNDRGELARYLTPNIYWGDAEFIDKNDLCKNLDEVQREVDHMIDLMNDGHDVSAHHGVYVI